MTRKETATHKAEDNVAKAGAEAFKNGFEKAAQGYDKVLGFGKESADAYMEAANATGKGVESFQREVYIFSKQSIEETLATTKSVLGAKSMHEALEIQGDFAKSAFDSYVGQMNRLNEIVLSTAKDAFAPFQGRLQVWVQTVQSSHIA